MYTFQLSTEIHKPVDTVIRLYSDRSLHPKWNPGLVSDELTTGKNGEKQYKTIYGKGRRKLVMKETILRDALPGLYVVRYEMKGVINTVRNSFVPISPGVTKWNAEFEYSFKGLKNLIATYMRSNFEKQSTIIMNNFKGFAESVR